MESPIENLDRPDKLPSLVVQAEPGEQPGVLAHTDSVRKRQEMKGSLADRKQSQIPKGSTQAQVTRRLESHTWQNNSRFRQKQRNLLTLNRILESS